MPNHRVFLFLYIFLEQITFAHAALVAFLQPFKSHRQYSIHTGVQPHCWIALYTSVISLIWLSTVFGPLIIFDILPSTSTNLYFVCLSVSSASSSLSLFLFILSRINSGTGKSRPADITAAQRAAVCCPRRLLFLPPTLCYDPSILNSFPCLKSGSFLLGSFLCYLRFSRSRWTGLPPPGNSLFCLCSALAAARERDCDLI